MTQRKILPWGRWSKIGKSSISCTTYRDPPWLIPRGEFSDLCKRSSDDLFLGCRRFGLSGCRLTLLALLCINPRLLIPVYFLAASDSTRSQIKLFFTKNSDVKGYKCKKSQKKTINHQKSLPFPTRRQRGGESERQEFVKST
jgi:hypothetical protein